MSMRPPRDAQTHIRVHHSHRSLRDAYTVISWVHARPGAPGRTTSSLLLAGDSAGGNLSLVLCLLTQQGVDADLRADQSAAGLFERIAHVTLLYPDLYEPLPRLVRAAALDLCPRPLLACARSIFAHQPAVCVCVRA